MEIAADSKICQRNLARAKDFARSDDGVVLRVAEVVSVTHIGTYFRAEEFSGIRSVFRPRVAVEPAEVGKSKRLRVWIGGIGGIRLRFTDAWSRRGCRSHGRSRRRGRNRGLGGREMVSLWSRGTFLPELYQLLLDRL